MQRHSIKPRIRSVQANDLASILAIYSHEVLHGTASWEYEPPSQEEMLSRISKVVQDGYPYIVAELEGAVAGYAHGSAYRSRPGYRFLVENSIYVAQEFQRRGIARSLMRELIQQCTTCGFRQMIAVIGDSANVASIALHEDLGFEHVALLPSVGFKFGRWLDSVQMQRSLGEGDQSLPV